MRDLEALRRRAVAHSLFDPTDLSTAIDRLGFVQADPIRSPARAQDLILRLRVDGYRAGELERRYPALAVEEDLLYAYGFLPRAVFALLHPRRTGRVPRLERRILDAVRERGATHPNELEAEFGGKRVVNAWGGHSKETKRALERLHHRGLLRVVARQSGVRVYEVAPALEQPLAPTERLERLVQVVANVLAPVAAPTLRAIASRLRAELPGAAAHTSVIAGLERSGALERHDVGGLQYLSPPTRPTSDGDGDDEVRFLAPFDPLVWDRRRFEQLWGWSYRFEAYTPVRRRVRGYYAMPLLWRDRLIGWSNAQVEDDRLLVEVGFVDKRPRERAFLVGLEEESARLQRFLGISGWTFV